MEKGVEELFSQSCECVIASHSFTETFENLPPAVPAGFHKEDFDFVVKIQKGKQKQVFDNFTLIHSAVYDITSCENMSIELGLFKCGNTAVIRPYAVQERVW